MPNSTCVVPIKSNTATRLLTPSDTNSIQVLLVLFRINCVTTVQSSITSNHVTFIFSALPHFHNFIYTFVQLLTELANGNVVFTAEDVVSNANTVPTSVDRIL